MVTCPKPSVQYHKQDTDIDTTCRCYSAFPSVLTGTSGCDSVPFYHVRRFIYLPPRSKHQTGLTIQGCLLLSFYSPNPNVCPPPLKFCLFKKCQKWNHTACNLWGLAFFTQPKFPGDPFKLCISVAHSFWGVGIAQWESICLVCSWVQ